MVTTWLIPFTLLSIVFLLVDTSMPLLVAAVIGGVAFVLDLVYYFILKLYNNLSLPSLPDIGSIFKSNKSYDTKKSSEEETSQFENEDTAKIKQLMADIAQKIDGLKKYNGVLEDKKRDFKEVAIKTIRTAFGSHVSGMSYGDCFSRYTEIKDDYSDKIDALIAAQCDKNVETANKKIAKADETIRNNKNDIKKYQQMSESLQKQYDKEIKIQQIKSLNKDLNTISDDEQSNLDIVNKEMEFNQIMQDFNTLNQEIEVRRDVEVQYGLIDI